MLYFGRNINVDVNNNIGAPNCRNINESFEYYVSDLDLNAGEMVVFARLIMPIAARFLFCNVLWNYLEFKGKNMRIMLFCTCRV